MSGRVVDEIGNPVPDAIVEVDYAAASLSSNPPSTCPLGDQFCWLATHTNAAGEYSVEFSPQAWPGHGLGYVYAVRDGYEVDVQWVPVGLAPSAARDLHVRRTRAIAPGQSIDVTVTPASSLCTDLEDTWVLTSRCEVVVIESAAGTLNVEARPAVSLLWYTTGNYTGFITQPSPGTLSIPAGGGTYRILIPIPGGAPAQIFNVTASLR